MPDPPAGPGDSYDLGEHQLSVTLFEHGRGERDIDGTVGQRQGLGQALAEIDPVEKPLAAGQCPRLAQQIWVDVAADHAVGTARAPRQGPRLAQQIGAHVAPD